MFIFPQPVWQKTFRKKNPGSLNISENPKFPNFHKHVIFVTSDLFFSQGFLQNGGVFSPTKRFRRLPATGVILGPLRQYSIWEVPGNDVMRPLWPTFYRSGLEGLEGRDVSTGFWELGKKTTSGWNIEIKGLGWVGGILHQKNVHEIILKVKGYEKKFWVAQVHRNLVKITSCQAVKKLAKWEREHFVDIDFHAFTSSVFDSLPVGSLKVENMICN